MTASGHNSLRNGPDDQGRFGRHGGRFVSETLMPLIHQLQAAYMEARSDPRFQEEMLGHLKTFVGRPSPHRT